MLQWLNNSKKVLPLASGTFLNAFATALMTMSLTETLTSYFSVNWAKRKLKLVNNKQPHVIGQVLNLYLWAPFEKIEEGPI